MSIYVEAGYATLGYFDGDITNASATLASTVSVSAQAKDLDIGTITIGAEFGVQAQGTSKRYSKEGYIVNGYLQGDSITGSATLSAQVNISSSAQDLDIATATINTAVSVSTTPSVTKTSTTTLSAQFSQAVTGFDLDIATATLSNQFTISTTAASLRYVKQSYSTEGYFINEGQVKAGTVLQLSSGTVSADAVITAVGVSTPASQITLSSQATKIKTAVTSVTSSVSTQQSAQRTRNVSSTITTSVSVNAFAQDLDLGIGLLISSGAITAQGGVIKSTAQATVDSEVSTAIEFTRIKAFTSSFSETVSTSLSAQPIFTGSTTLQTEFTTSTQGQDLDVASTTLATEFALASSCIRIRPATVTLQTSVSQSANAVRTRSVDATLEAQVSVSCDAQDVDVADATLNVVFSTGIISQATLRGTATLNTQASVSSLPDEFDLASTLLVSSGTVTTEANKIHSTAQATLTAQASTTQSSVQIKTASVTMPVYFYSEQTYIEGNYATDGYFIEDGPSAVYTAGAVVTASVTAPVITTTAIRFAGLIFSGTASVSSSSNAVFTAGAVFSGTATSPSVSSIPQIPVEIYTPASARPSKEFSKTGQLSISTVENGFSVLADETERLNVGSGDFTIECWHYFKNTPTNEGYVHTTQIENSIATGNYLNTGNVFRFYDTEADDIPRIRVNIGAIVTTNTDQFGVSTITTRDDYHLFMSVEPTDDSVVNPFGNPTSTVNYDPYSNPSKSNSEITPNQWNHIALVRNDGVLTLYLNGIADNFTLNDSNYFATPTLLVGARGEDADPDVVGEEFYYDTFRFSDEARYTTNFTPFTTPQSSDGNTVVLVRGDDALIDAGDNSIQGYTQGSATTIFNASGELQTGVTQKTTLAASGEYVIRNGFATLNSTFSISSDPYLTPTVYYGGTGTVTRTTGGNTFAGQGAIQIQTTSSQQQAYLYVKGSDFADAGTLASGDEFTVEFFFKLDGATSNNTPLKLFEYHDTTTADKYIGFYAKPPINPSITNSVSFGYIFDDGNGTGGTVDYNESDINLNTWCHIALQYNGEFVQAFADGRRLLPYPFETDSTNAARPTNTFTTAHTNSQWRFGDVDTTTDANLLYMDNIRISRGLRYNNQLYSNQSTYNFTPPGAGTYNSSTFQWNYNDDSSSRQFVFDEDTIVLITADESIAGLVDPTELASASLTSRFVQILNGGFKVNASATLSTQATTSQSVTRIRPGVATLSAEASVSSALRIDATGVVTTTNQFTISQAILGVTRFGEATITASASLSADALDLDIATATLASAVTTSIIGGVIKPFSAQLDVLTSTVQSALDLDTASATLRFNRIGDTWGDGGTWEQHESWGPGLFVQGEVVIEGDATLTPQASVTVSSQNTLVGTVSITSTFDTDIDYNRIRASASLQASSGTLTASGVVTVLVTQSFNSEFTVLSQGIRAIQITKTLASEFTVSTSALDLERASATLTAEFDVDTTATKIVQGVAEFNVLVSTVQVGEDLDIATATLGSEFTQRTNGGYLADGVATFSTQVSIDKALLTKYIVEPFRQYTIKSETRTLVLESQNRLWQITSESRVNNIDTEQRTFIIPSETRILYSQHLELVSIDGVNDRRRG